MSDLLYENDIVGIDYAEPFAGGAGLALRLLFDEYIGVAHINDLDPYIYTFWKCVLRNNSELCDWIYNVDVTIDEWMRCRDIYRNPKYTDPIEVAKAVLFLNRTNVSGILKGAGVIGGIKQTGKYKINARFSRDSIISKLDAIKLFKDRIVLTNMDGIEFIKKLKLAKYDSFIYMDPPYYKKGAKLYMNYYKESDHSMLAKVVASISKRWLISYDDNDFISDLYNAHKRVRYRLPHSTSNKIGDELLIFSERITFHSSIDKLASSSVLP